MPRVIVKKRCVNEDVQPTAQRRANGAPVEHEPSVQLLRRDGVVHALEVRCSCGSIHTVQLEYGAAPAQPNEQAPPAG